MLSILTIVISLISWIVTFFILFGASKYYQFKRNTASYAFLVSAILFVFSSLILFLFEIINFTPPNTIYGLFMYSIISLIVSLIITLYLIKKIYMVTLRESFKVLFVLILSGIVLGFILFLIFLIFGPDFASAPSFKTEMRNESCEERYSTYPFSGLSEEEKRGLLTCLTNQAIEENDPFICEKTSDKNSCYAEYAIKKLEVPICKKISEPIQYFCYFSIAREKKDSSICGALPEESLFGDLSTCKINVELDVAVSENNINYCEFIEIDWIKDICYIKFAKARLDQTLCNEIEYEEYNSISECVESVNKWRDLKEKGNNLPEYYWS